MIHYPIHHRLLLFLLILLLGGSVAMAEKKPKSVYLRGNVRDRATSIQLLNAEVSLLDENDSVVAKTKAVSRRYNGKRREMTSVADFYVLVPDVKKSYCLKIEYPEYETLELYPDLSDVGSRERNRSLGTIFLDQERNLKLDEVSVTGSKVKFYHKGDTIVFNAAAFQLAEGSMLDDLIKVLPGVELKDNGQIYVNGRYVESLLLNGKDFFKGNNQVMLENLGAYTVKDIQVYEKPSDKDRFMGVQTGMDEYVMDVSLKKEYIGGWTFNTQGGLGTEDRYVGRFFGLHFTPQQRFTVYANFNNLNDKRKPGSDDEALPDDGARGRNTEAQAGLDYNIELDTEGKKTLEGSLQAVSQRNHLMTTSTSLNFFPMGNITSRSISDRNNRKQNLNTNHKFIYEGDMTMFGFEPQLSYDRGRNRSLSRSVEFNRELSTDDAARRMDEIFAGGINLGDRADLTNAVYSDAFSGSNRLRMSAKAYASFKVPKTSDAIHLFLQGGYNNDRASSSSDYMIGYGDPSLKPTARRQRTADKPNHNYYMIGEFTYQYMPVEGLYIRMTGDVRYDNWTKHSDFYLAEVASESTGDYTLENLDGLTMQFDPANSYASTETSRRLQINPSVQYNFTSKGRCFIGVDVPIANMDRRLDYVREGVMTPVRHNSWIIRRGSAYFIVNNSKGKEKLTRMYVEYGMDTKQPSLVKMIDIADTKNPLNTYLGNPDLKNAIVKRLNASFNHDVPDVYSVGARFSGQWTSNDMVNGYKYMPTTGERFYKTYNIGGNRSFTAAFNGSLRFGKKKCMDINGSLDGVLSRNGQMIGEGGEDPIKSVMNDRTLTERLSYSWEFGKQRLSLHHKGQFRHGRSTRAGSMGYDAQDYSYGLMGVFKLPYGFGIATDLKLYMRRGYDSKEMNTDDLVWNMRLTKNFGRHWTLYLDGFDLLHQLKNVSYYLSPTGRTESYTNTLPRYIMFSAQYKVSIAPKRKQLTDNVKKF